MLARIFTMQSSGHEPENSISSPILSPKNRRTLSGLTVLSLLHILINSDHLSRIHTFNLAMLPRWYTDRDEDDRKMRGYNHLSRQFWIDLGNNCRRLRHVIVDGIRDSFKRENTGKYISRPIFHSFDGWNSSMPFRR